MEKYNELLKETISNNIVDPAQKIIFDFDVSMSPWIAVDALNYEERCALGEVIGFNPKWVDEDFNPKGLRVCCFTGEFWQSAKWCSYHDEYEPRPRDHEDETADEFAPVFICHMPNLKPEFDKLIEVYLKEQEESE